MNSALRVPLRREHLPVATGFVRTTAKAFGADEQMEYALVLAVEEIFARVSDSASPGDDFAVELRDGGYCIEVRLLFPATGIEFGAFNLTAGPATEKEVEGDDLGLYLAARFVDRFQLSFPDRNTVVLTLVKERLYPEVSRETATGQSPPEAGFAIVRPGQEQIVRLAELAVTRFDAGSMPDFLLRPGKAIDMLQAGGMEAALAVTPGGVIGGGIFWRLDGRKPEMIGPYVISESQHQAMVDALVEECFRCTARTQAVGVFCRMTPEVLGAKHFEILGETVRHLKGDRRTSQRYYYRHLIEDAGSVIYCHPGLQAFLERECERLVLPREIRPVKDWGERIAGRSLVACDFHSSAVVTMRGIVAGRDAVQNVAAHLARFEQERIGDIRFELDLGQAWQASFAPALEAAGMTPAVLVPNAATGDLLVFQKVEW